MAEHFIPTRSIPRHTRFTARHHPLAAAALVPGARTYKSSPEEIALQLRTGKGFAHVNLTRDEALQLAAQLTEEAGRI